MISYDGDISEQKFYELVPGSKKPLKAKSGDAVLRVNGRTEYVEIKKCDANWKTIGTINQVRASKCTPIIIDARKREVWYVSAPEKWRQILVSSTILIFETRVVNTSNM